MLGQSLSRGSITGHDVDDPGGNTSFLAKSGESKCGERRELGRLQHHGISSRERRGNLPCEHQKREVPGNDLANNSSGFVLWKFLVQQLRPTSVIVKMPRH